MKNQYFGDQTDYIKYGILRAFVMSGARLGIHWTLTDDDGSSDGSRIRYLDTPSQWRHYDPPIFDAICNRVRAGDRRLRIVDELSFVPNSVQSFDRWEARSESRLNSIHALLNQLSANSVVFIDPDNGLEVASTKKDKLGASKYVFLDEVGIIWQRGHSVVIYQHYPRVQRIPYAREQLRRLKAVLPGMNEAALLTDRVAFLACIQEQHRQIVSSSFDRIVEHWAPHVSAISFDGAVQLASKMTCSQGSFQHELPL
jgi:hypothetical protein